MPAASSVAALLEQDLPTRIVVRCDRSLLEELQAMAPRVGARSANQLAKALIRDGLARLAAEQPEAA